MAARSRAASNCRAPPLRFHTSIPTHVHTAFHPRATNRAFLSATPIVATAPAACSALIQKHWGRLTKSSEEKEAQIAKVRTLLATGKGDAPAGRELFKVVCATCHKLNNEGVNIGPDLTGYERDNLDFILPAIVDPSLAIREEYTAFNVTTKDDQSLTGFLLENTPQSVTISDLNQNKLVIARRDLQTL